LGTLDESSRNAVTERGRGIGVVVLQQLRRGDALKFYGEAGMGSQGQEMEADGGKAGTSGRR